MYVGDEDMSVEDDDWDCEVFVGDEDMALEDDDWDSFIMTPSFSQLNIYSETRSLHIRC